MRQRYILSCVRHGARGRPPRPSAHVMSKTRDETSVVACLCTSHISKSARVMQSMVFLRTSPHIVCVSTQTRVSRRKGHNSTLGYSICGVGDRWERQCEQRALCVEAKKRWFLSRATCPATLLLQPRASYQAVGALLLGHPTHVRQHVALAVRQSVKKCECTRVHAFTYDYRAAGLGDWHVLHTHR